MQPISDQTSPPPAPFNADLHTHSSFSDGFLTPQELVFRAHHNGVTMLALTDHDTLDGLPEAADAAASQGLRLIPGVEISVSWIRETVHIVGLNIDPTHPALVDGLTHIRQDRLVRAQKMSDALAEAGFHNMLEKAMRFARNPHLVSRAHFARALVVEGAVSNVHDVFRHYLSPDKPGYVPQEWAELEDSLAWIHQAGGVAIIAHPGRYWRLSKAELGDLFEQFSKQGGQGIEVVSSAHDAQAEARFARVAREYDFVASRASDFHGPDESLIDVGYPRPLPPDLTPVWNLF